MPNHFKIVYFSSNATGVLNRLLIKCTFICSWLQLENKTNHKNMSYVYDITNLFIIEFWLLYKVNYFL